MTAHLPIVRSTLAQRVMQNLADRKDAAIAKARVTHATETGFKRAMAGVLLDNAEVLAQGRSFTQVYKNQYDVVVHDNGQHTVTRREVLMPTISKCLAVVGALFACGAFATVFGYASTGAGAVVFGAMYLGARWTRNRPLQKTAGRMMTLMACATCPVLGTPFAALSLAAEINAYLPKRDVPPQVAAN